MNLFNIRLAMKSVAAVAFLLATISAFGQANPQPYTPSGWSGPLVVTTNSSSTTQSPTMNTANTLYVDWCVANFGSSPATFNLNLYVDGVLNQSWPVSGLASSTYTTVQGQSIGALSAGTHAIIMTISANNVSYTNTITVTAGPPPLPNLTPYQPSGWSSPLVVTTNASSFTQSPTFTTTNTVYVDWAVINNGNASAGAFTTALYVDGVQVQSWNSGSLPVSSYTDVTGYSIGTLTAGTHKIAITADTGNTVSESNESDNSYTNTITVTAISIPAPTLSTPANTATGQSTTPGFGWSAVTGVNGYRIMVATSAADLPTSPSASSGGPSVAINAVTTNNAYTNTVPLVPNTTYYWEVHGRAGGDNGNWSGIFSFTTATPPSGLTIIPTFASSITSDPQAATIESTINAAIGAYQNNFSDPITVKITFAEMSSGLGESSTSPYEFSYASYRAALVAHATTADDNTALTYLPGGSTNPVTGDPNMYLQLPLARALGLTSTMGSPDGTIYLNTSLMNLSGGNTVATNYALFSVVSHEIDEVLGLTSILDGVVNGAPVPTGPADPEDLFRYDGTHTGTRSFSTAANAVSWFSLDGTNYLAQFNQEQGGDFHDWYSYPNGAATPQVQDAYGTPGVTPVLGVELRVLDAVGFTRVVPQFTIVASAGSGGSISPAGSTNKNVGTSQSFTATPDGTHFVNQWLLDSVVAQTGGTTYTLANIQTNHTLQVTFAAKTNQTITFRPLPSRAYGEPAFPLVASASSGLAVSFAIASGPATLAGTNLTMTGLGTVNVQASQGGNINYNAAANVNQSFVVYAPPGLNLTGAGGNVLISWTTNVAGFTLLETTNLGHAGSWQAVTPAPAIVNGQYVVTNAFSGQTVFYRLEK